MHSSKEVSQYLKNSLRDFDTYKKGTIEETKKSRYIELENWFIEWKLSITKLYKNLS